MFSDYPINWQLNHDYYTGLADSNLSQDWQSINGLVDSFVINYKGKMAQLNAEGWLKFFADDEELDFMINKVYDYLFYLSSLDTQNQEVLKKKGELMQQYSEWSNKMLFVGQEMKGMGWDKLIELSKEPTLEKWNNYFVQTANDIKYVLDEKTESALTYKSQAGSSVFKKMYTELTGSLGFKIDKKLIGEEGEGEKELTDAEIRALRMDEREEVRKTASEVIRNVYYNKQLQITLGSAYSAVVKSCVADIKIRGYQNVMSARNLSEQLPDEAVDTLLKVVEQSYPLFHRYIRAKAKLLASKGQNQSSEKLDSWNLFAPIPSPDRKEYNFEQAMELYLSVVKEFDQEFYDYSVDMWKNGRIDAYPGKGKRGGAFCSYAKNHKSHILLNHTNKLEDVSTLAHEMGHALHGYFSQSQPSQVFHTGMSLAETASVFNETLLNEHLLKQMQTGGEKESEIAFLENQLQDIFSTIFRQVQYILFERRCHQAILDGKELSYEDFNKMWREEQEKMSGQGLSYQFKAEEEVGWSAIPHIFHTPFYCYSYALGNILSFALYQLYKEQGQPFVEKYKNILRSGGSKTPYDLLLSLGIDITKPAFYEAGVKVIENLLTSFEESIKI